MKPGENLLAAMGVVVVCAIAGDILYTSRFVPRFKEIEKQRIVTSNQLATAKIVSENLNHVRDLVYRNMQFSGQKDSLPQETQLFDFLSTCVNDLKLRLVSVKPGRPSTQGRVTTTGFDISLEGDFFSFGELCSKLENSRRVMAITSFSIHQNDRVGAAPVPSSGKQAKVSSAPAVARRAVSIQLHLETYQVRKG
jgi:hypothetical protein